MKAYDLKNWPGYFLWSLGVACGHLMRISSLPKILIITRKFPENFQNVENLQTVENLQHHENFENVQNFKNVENLENLKTVENFGTVDINTFILKVALKNVKR